MTKLKNHAKINETPTPSIEPKNAEMPTRVNPATKNTITAVKTVTVKNETNAASIVVTHQMSTITRTADRVIMLYDGKIVFEGTPAELLKQETPYTKQFVTASLEGPMQMQA